MWLTPFRRDDQPLHSTSGCKTVDTAKVEFHLRRAVGRNNKGLNKLDETVNVAIAGGLSYLR